MKEMNFPLDIIWLDSEQKIIDIRSNLQPDSYPKTFSPNQPAQYVLEVPAGFAQNHNLNLGQKAF